MVNPNKSGKVRVVFDATGRYENVSFNQKLLKGPDLLTSLIGVLLRFRQLKIALSADITKNFHQVRVREQDGSALRFLWLKPGNSQAPSDLQNEVPFLEPCRRLLFVPTFYERQPKTPARTDASVANKLRISFTSTTGWHNSRI